MRGIIGLAAVLGALVGAASAHAAPSPTYQLNAAHTGATVEPGLDPPFARRWAVDLGQPTSFPVIGDGRVFVVARNESDYGTQLYALAASDGRLLWRRAVAGSYYWAGIAYGDGKVFVVSFDGPIQALDASTGAVVWSRDHSYWFSSEPTYADGVVYLNGGGSGGGLMALDAATGADRWSRFICCGDHSPPALAGGRLYLGYSCDAYAVDAATGRDVWHVNDACSGGGGKAVVVHGGRIYTRDSFDGVVRDAGTGAALRTFVSSTAPAIWGDTAYSVVGETLYAASVPDLTPRWSFSDTGISIAPIVVNGTVIVGSTTGHLYALDGAGRVLWCDAVGRSIEAPDEHNVSRPLAGLAAGDGLLVVPAEGLIVAYGPGGRPGCTPPRSEFPPTPHPGPAPAAGPTLTLRAGKTDLWIGQRTRLRGRLSGVARVARRRVVLEVDEWPFRRFRPAARARTGRAGRFAFLARPPRNVRVRARVGRLRSRVVTLWADRPASVRVRGRGGSRPRIRFTLFTPRRDKARRKVVSAYLARGDTEPWRLVARRRFQRLRRFTATVTLRFPPGSLGRGDHWMLCLPERRPDAYGRPTEIERRCGAAEIPRGV